MNFKNYQKKLCYFKCIFLWIFFLVFFPQLSIGQEIGPPSLSIGANEVLFTKGILDVKLIGEIIAEKQSEIKKEFAKEQILNKRLSEGPYLTYSYAEKVLTTLLDHQEKSVIKKSLLEYGTELGIVYGITEGFIRIRRRTTRKLEDKYEKFLTKNTNASKMTHQEKSNANDGKYLTRISLLYEMKNIGDYKNNYLHYILLDMMLEICIDNTSLQKLGFFQTEFDKTALKKKSKYHQFLNLKLDNEEYKELVAELKDVKDIVEQTIDVNLDFAGAVLEQPLSQDSPKDKATVYTEVKTLVEYSYTNLLSIEYEKNQISKEDEETIKRTGRAIYSAKSILLNKDYDTRYDDLILEFRSLIPDLIKVGHKVSNIKKLVKNLNNVIILLTNYQYDVLCKRLKDINDGYEVKAINKDLAELFKVLANLDKAESYDKIAKLIVNAGNIFPKKNYARLFNNISNLQKYIIVNKDSNRVDIRVEDMLLFLYDEYISDASSIVSLYFTVGYNHLFGTDTSYNVSYASEKIGLKLKILDCYKKSVYKSDNIIPKRKPILHDIYLLGYASGLLYQIEALKTEDSFNSSTYGGALGFHFFNGLDFNIGVASVNLNNKRRAMINAGFDVPLAEYISKLAQKRKNKKN